MPSTSKNTTIPAAPSAAIKLSPDGDMRFIAPKIDIISVLYNKNERILFTFIIRNSKLRKNKLC